MAATITACRKLIGQGETGGQASGGETETAIYEVTVTQYQATPLEVCRATFAGYPAYGSTHAINTNIKVVNKVAKRGGDKAKNIWHVTVTWDVPQPISGGGTTGDTANSKNIRIRVSGQETSILTQTANDTSKTPIRNAVGDLFPDPIEQVIYDEAISVDFEAISVNMDLAATSRGKINNGPVTMTIPQGNLSFSRTFPKHTLLLKSVDYEVTVSKTDPTQNVWSCSILLLYRPDTWNKVLPQKGYRWKDASGNLTDWKDHAEYLAADGKKLGSGAQIVGTSPIQTYKEANLAALLNGI